MEPTTVAQHQQPGRNDPCPCGSGRKHKKCCMPGSAGVPSRMARIQASGLRILKEHEDAERKRVGKFGHVRPAIHADYRGYKVVAIGDQVVSSKAWRTFPDFLANYIKRVLVGIVSAEYLWGDVLGPHSVAADPVVESVLPGLRLQQARCHLSMTGSMSGFLAMMAAGMRLHSERRARRTASYSSSKRALDRATRPPSAS